MLDLFLEPPGKMRSRKRLTCRRCGHPMINMSQYAQCPFGHGKLHRTLNPHEQRQAQSWRGLIYVTIKNCAEHFHLGLSHGSVTDTSAVHTCCNMILLNHDAYNWSITKPQTIGLCPQCKRHARKFSSEHLDNRLNLKTLKIKAI